MRPARGTTRSSTRPSSLSMMRGGSTVNSPAFASNRAAAGCGAAHRVVLDRASRRSSLKEPERNDRSSVPSASA